MGARVTEAERERAAQVLAVLRGARAVTVTFHQRPDADAVGGALALASLLRRLGVEAEVVSPDPVPPHLAFLPGSGGIAQTRELPPCDVAVLLDSSDWARCMECARPPVVVNIDHHETNRMFGTVNWVDPSAAATCQMLVALFEEARGGIEPEEAQCLYAGILNDSGRFCYRAVTPETLRRAALLLEAGADPAWAAANLYEREAFDSVRLRGMFMAKTRLAFDGRVAWTEATLTEMGGVHSSVVLWDELVDTLRRVPGVEVAIVFKESEDGRVRVSLRSKGRVSVNGIAAAFGGGGHPPAAGCFLDGDLERVREKVLAAVGEALEKLP